jgi:hypothetical protein
MSDIKIGIIGGDQSDRDSLLEALAEIYSVTEVDFDIVQGEPLTTGQMPKRKWGEGKPKRSNEWRGGSRGKGGKTRWPRR